MPMPGKIESPVAVGTDGMPLRWPKEYVGIRQGEPVLCGHCQGDSDGCDRCTKGIRQYVGLGDVGYRAWPAEHYGTGAPKPPSERFILNRRGDRLEELELNQVKTAYWNRCINGFDPWEEHKYTRLVGKKRRLKSSGESDDGDQIKIWVPKSVDEDFNLVLSLCDDGLHRPLRDIDDPALALDPRVFLEGGRVSIVPSTTGFHGYCHVVSSFDDAVEWCGNDGYRFHVKNRGFASLRPPWVVKEGYQPPVFDKADFWGFNDEDWVPAIPKDDGTVGWEDLFGDE